MKKPDKYISEKFFVLGAILLLTTGCLPQSAIHLLSFADSPPNGDLSLNENELDKLFGSSENVPEESNELNDCRIIKTSVNRGIPKKWSDTIYLPKSGIFYQEGHLVTKEDEIKGFPESNTEKIDEHLQRSAKILGAEISKIYPNRWAKRWTPPENGKAGQGSIGPVKPSAKEEMYIFNMMFKDSSMPKRGEKWLMSYNGRYVIVVGGYEKGPSSSSRLGGVQPEVLFVLGAKNPARLTLHGPLKNQKVAPGRIQCSKIEYVKE